MIIENKKTLALYRGHLATINDHFMTLQLYSVDSEIILHLHFISLQLYDKTPKTVNADVNVYHTYLAVHRSSDVTTASVTVTPGEVCSTISVVR